MHRISLLFISILLLFGFTNIASAQTAVSGIISTDTTWTAAASPYTFGNAVTISSGVTLTLEPGVVVKASGNGALSVRGTLVANGTPENKIYFTSRNDDTIGGDLDGNANNTTPSPGDWSQIRVFEGGRVELSQTIIRYGGNRSTNNCGYRKNCFGTLHVWSGEAILDNVTFSDNKEYGIYGNGTITVSNSEFQRSAAAISFKGIAEIRNTLFQDNLGYSGNYSKSYAAVNFGSGSLTFEDNVFADNGRDFIIEAGSTFVHSGNRFTSGARHGFYMKGSIATDTIWQATDVIPYVLDKNVGVPSGATLTIEPGAVIKAGGNNALTVSGTLIANGAPENKIYFTSDRDSSIGGNINNYGTTTIPLAGDWSQIRVVDGGVVDISNAVLRYGGRTSANNCGYRKNCFGAIHAMGGTVSLDNVLITDNDRFGIIADNATTTITNSKIRKSGVAIKAGGTITARNNIFYDNDGYLWDKYAVDVSGNVTFEDNIFEENSRDMSVVADSIFVHSGNVGLTPGGRGFYMGGSIATTTTWTRTDNIPYVIPRSVSVAVGGVLNIEAGAILKFTDWGYFGSMGISGELNVNGTREDPVYFTSSNDIVGGGTGGSKSPAARDWRSVGVSPGGVANIRGAVFSYGGRSPITYVSSRKNAVLQNYGTMNITDSIFQDNAPWGIWQSAGTLSITDSEITTSDEGVRVEAGNVTISNSSLYGNETAVNNLSTTTVMAQGNWWGDATGPKHTTNTDGLGDEIIGDVDFEPWLGAEPGTESGYSNVVFLPGLQGSRLYKDGILFTENKLWEPNRNDDMRKLYLNEDGTSIDSSIYTADIIDTALGLNIYKKFSIKMDKLVSEGTIAEWEAMPYDWRMGLEEVLDNDVLMRDGDTYNIIERVIELAEISDTGKVTIVAHSNGGLLGKLLISRLREQGKEDLIDTFIMVATPQLGTPSAIIGLLHGGERSIVKGFIQNREVTRELAENMKSAYTLLPSPKYFDIVNTSTQPIIKFTPTSVTGYLRSVYGSTISTFGNLQSFLNGEEGVRSEPIAGKVDEPNVLDVSLLNEAEILQRKLDAWVPEDVRVVQIAGYGLDTIRGVEYFDKDVVCVGVFGGLTCQNQSPFNPQPMWTQSGDQTVVEPSAVAMQGEKYYFDLPDYNDELDRNSNHADILEAGPVQSLIEKIIARDVSILPKYISTTTPFINESILRLAMHSPVSVGVYDSFGNYTGIIPNPDPTSDLVLVEEQIPNSYYLEFGEGKYLGLDTTEEYRIELQGEDLGTFTFNVEEVLGEEVVNTISYENIPVSASTTAVLLIQNLDTAPELALDIDGDGITDITLTGGEEDMQASFEILVGILETMNIESSLRREITRELKKAQKELAKGKTRKAIKNINRIIKKLKKEVKKNEREAKRNAKHEEKHERDEKKEKKHEDKDGKEDKKHKKEEREEKKDKQHISTVDAQQLISILGQLKESVI